MKHEPEINEKNLVHELKNGESKAFDLLFRKYYQKLFNFSYSLLNDKEDARDIVQDTFYKIWDTRSNLDATKSFKAFLFTISYHMIIDQLRSRIQDQLYRKYLEDTFGFSSIHQDTQFDSQMMERRINSIIEKLPCKRKEIFFLSRKNGLSYKEIAITLGISSKTVENQINLTLKHIKFRLKTEITG